MLAESTVHPGGASFSTTHLRVSPVQLFLLRAVDFSLAFLFSSVSMYRTSQTQPYRVCQTWLRGSGASCARVRSGLCSDRRRVCTVFLNATNSSSTVTHKPENTDYRF